MSFSWGYGMFSKRWHEFGFKDDMLANAFIDHLTKHKEVTFLKKYMGQATIYSWQGSVRVSKKLRLTKVVAEIQRDRLNWGAEQSLVTSIQRYAEIWGVKHHKAFDTKPRVLWNAQEKAAAKKRGDVKRQEKKDNEEKQKHTTKIKVSTIIELYEYVGGSQSSYYGSPLYFLRGNKGWGNITYYLGIGQDGEFFSHRCRLPALRKLKACTPLDFAVQTGTSFTKVLREHFGLEIIEDKVIS